MKLFKKVLDFIYPRICISCGKINFENHFDYVCEDCSKNILNSSARCLRCSEPLIGKFEESTTSCAKCFEEKFYFENSYCPTLFVDTNAEIIKELKYKSGLHLLNDIAKIFNSDAIFKEFTKDAILIPVPLHSSKLRKRGFNQSEEIAKALCKNSKKLKYANILKRISHTETQTQLHRTERAENIKNAFALRKNSLDKNSKIILLDDIITTGATLNECAKVLKKAHFTNIHAMAFAKRPFLI